MLHKTTHEGFIIMDRKFRLMALSAAAAMIMLLIFAFSSKNVYDSIGQSMKISELLCRLIFFRFDEMTAAEQSFVISELDLFVRKAAHFSVYMLLGACVYLVLRLSNIKIRTKRIAALAVCIAYAMLDELHQSFVPGRTMLAGDVFIDSAGAAAGIAAASVVIIIWKYTAEHRRS